jgi:hypothetical protein
MASKNYEQKYTKPDLREKIKEEIKQSSKGGKKGKWSARKSQLLVNEYEKKGGEYKKDKNNQEANSLKEWTEQDWQTSEGKGKARQDGIMKRYLPKKVWDKLSEKERREANKIKENADRMGKHKVEWTPAIKRAFKEAGFDDQDGEQQEIDYYQKAKQLDLSGRSKMKGSELEKAVKAELSKQFDSKNRQELYAMAQKKGISGRSKLNKDQLKKKLVEKELTTN